MPKQDVKGSKKPKPPSWTTKEDETLRSLVHVTRDGQNEQNITWWEIATHMQTIALETEFNENYREYTEFAVKHRWYALKKETKEAKKKAGSEV